MPKAGKRISAVAKVQDMTVGKPIALMIKFSIPLLISNALQLLFAVADSAIVGRLLGVDAFASIGVTASAHWLVLSAIIGTNAGFGTLVAQRFGAKNMEGLRRAFVTAVYFAAAFGIAIGVIGIAVCEPLFRLLRTPPELLEGAVTYISWIWGGTPLVFGYNLLSMTLFALGDSKTPLRAMIIATFVNIAFDLILVMPFAIAGVAAASLITQTIAMLYCFRALLKTGVLRGCARGFDVPSAWPLLRLGLPLGFRNAVIEVGGLLAQRYINAYGTEFVAGIAAAKRMYSLLMIAGGAVEASISTFVAQNFGAKQLERVRRGVRDGLVLALCSAAIIMAIAFPFGRGILSLLIDDEAARVGEVLNAGVRQLSLMTAGLPFLYLLFLYRAALQGVGNTLIPMLSGFVELTLRIVSVVLLTRIIGDWGVLLSDPLAWPFAMTLLVVSYMVVLKKLRIQTER